MKLVWLSMIGVAAFIIGCGGTSHLKQDLLKSVRVTQLFPKLDQSGHVVGTLKNQIDYYFYDDLRIYRMPSEQDTVVGDSIVSLGFFDRYFIHHKDSLYGRIFFPKFQEYNVRSNIDSTTIVKRLLNLRLSEFFKVSNVNLIRTDTTPGGRSVFEYYRYSNIADTAQKGLLNLAYSSGFDDIPIQLSPYMDSIKHSRLYSYDAIAFGRFIPQAGIRADTLKFKVWMEKIGNPDKQRVMELIDIYSKRNRVSH